MSRPEELLITASTLGNPPFEELVDAAAAGGFSGLSIWPQETYRPAREAGLSDAAMNRLLSDAGVRVNDVDALVCWVGEGADPGPDSPSEREARLFAAADALGARLMNVVMMSDGPADPARMGETLAGVADRAASHGLRVHLEFVPFMAVPDARTAARVLDLAGRKDVGLMVDTWHCFRSDTQVEDLRALPGDRVLGIQVNDAPAEPMDNPVMETLHHRLVPGEGVIDLAGLLGALRYAGCEAPLTVEVFSDALLASGSPREIAERLGEATRRLLAGA